mmetsp:Transcript_163035/g.522799  ORF Transcript_163035/g.522799 Transcript_163035/m.522799 type:complete len:483 (-) Transcript_163035:273-1721(-)
MAVKQRRRDVDDGPVQAKHNAEGTRANGQGTGCRLICLVLLGASLFFMLLVAVLVRRGAALKTSKLLGVIAQSHELLREKPKDAIALLGRALRSGASESAMVRAQLLDALGDAHKFCRQFADSQRYYAEALAQKRAAEVTSEELAGSYQSLAEVTQVENPRAALDYLHEALDLPGLSLEAIALTLWVEVKSHECAGDFESALRRLDDISKLGRKFAQNTGYWLRYVSMLNRILRGREDLLRETRESLHARMESIKSALLKEGPWLDAEQMPPESEYTPGLATKPWHDLHDQIWEHTSHNSALTAASWLLAASRLVADATSELKREFELLQAGGHLRRQTECISSYGGGVWSFLEVWSPWEDRTADDCAAAAPVACRLVQRLQSAGMPIVRAGYSAVDAGTHLLRHTGTTNRVLKWHLGLYVPAMPEGCAQFQIANESRTWQEGQILFFDDSFEHEVWNRCASQRVVFQIVFHHPDLPLKARL